MNIDDIKALNNFKGIARLFPLPNLVLFPGVGQALHIFEPRYRQLTADALKDDRFIAIVLLRPGWETNYQGRPDIHRTACLGRITADERLPDGRFNLQLAGMARARIVHEINDGKLYRSAQVELVRDVPMQTVEMDTVLRQRLAKKLGPWCRGRKEALEVFRKLLSSDLHLGVIADIVSFALPLETTFKQKLLSRFDVERRVRSLIRYLGKKEPVVKAVGETQHKFPPDFSTN